MIEDGVPIGSGAKILGAITIGARSTVDANTVVVKDAPSRFVPHRNTRNQPTNHNLSSFPTTYVKFGVILLVSLGLIWVMSMSMVRSPSW